MSAIDQISRGRVGLLVLNGLSFAVWQVSEIGQVREVMAAGSVLMLGSAALVLWTVTLVALLAPTFMREHRIVEDELTRQNRRAAFTWGYWFVLAGAVAALFIASNMTVPAADLLRVVLIPGVTVPIIRFAMMERSASDGE